MTVAVAAYDTQMPLTSLALQFLFVHMKQLYSHQFIFVAF
jgi:hypothetical protein